MNRHKPLEALAPETIEKIETVACRTCGAEFETNVCTIYGKKLRDPLCGPCRKAELEQREIQRLKDIEDANQRAQELRNKYWENLCPVAFRLKTESDGETDMARIEAEQPLLGIVTGWQYQRRGLLVLGPSGASKTRAMWRLIRKLWEQGKKVRVLTAVEFDRDCRAAGGNFTQPEWFTKLATVDVLFLDDLGKGEWTPGTEAQWFDLVDNRTRNGKPILVTTNDTGKTLKEKMSESRGVPMIRRLREFCDVVTFTNKK